MRLWRIHLMPDAEPGTDPFDHCLRNGVVGIGWRVSRSPSDWEEYLKLGRQKYGDTAWLKAANAIGPEGMQVGDLVWCRKINDYYIGKVEGEWEYRDDEESFKADIVNVRQCKLYYVGKQVIDEIANSFTPATVQQIDNKTAALFSTVLFIVFNKYQ